MGWTGSPTSDAEKRRLWRPRPIVLVAAVVVGFVLARSDLAGGGVRKRDRRGRQRRPGSGGHERGGGSARGEDVDVHR